jgi:hypothetical protein
MQGIDDRNSKKERNKFRKQRRNMFSSLGMFPSPKKMRTEKKKSVWMKIGRKIT